MTTIRNFSDSYVNKAKPDTNYGSQKKLYTTYTGDTQSYIFTYASLGLPPGTRVSSAVLTMYGGEDITGAVTLAARMVKGKWSRNKITWKNQPDVWTDLVAIQNRTSPKAKTAWSLDVTAMMARIAAGRTNLGLRVELQGARSWFYSSRGDSDYRPTLTITYTDTPEPPSSLLPSGGLAVGVSNPIFTCDFSSPSADASLQGMQVQIFNAASTAASALEFDSGTIVTDAPQYDSSTGSWAGIAVGATRYWRARVQDSSGTWSDWSGLAGFMRTAKGTLTITNPSSSSPVVTESSPPIIWTFASATQKTFSVTLARTDSPQAVIWTSGKITSTATNYTLPVKDTAGRALMADPAASYRVTVRVWDDQARQSTPSDPAYVEASRDFTLQYSSNVAPVANFAANSDNPWPWVNLSWTRSAAPDTYEIYRDNVLIAKPTAADLLQSDGSYKYVDRAISARTSHTYSAVAVVNGVGSSSSPTASAKSIPTSRWIMEPDGGNAIMFLNPEVDASPAEITALQYSAANGAPPVLVVQAVRGLEGTASGLLVDDVVPGLSAAQMLARFKVLKKRMGETLVFYNVDQTIECFIYDVSWYPQAYGGGKTRYVISFSYVQTDY